MKDDSNTNDTNDLATDIAEAMDKHTIQHGGITIDAAVSAFGRIIGIMLSERNGGMGSHDFWESGLDHYLLPMIRTGILTSIKQHNKADWENNKPEDVA